MTNNAAKRRRTPNAALQVGGRPLRRLHVGLLLRYRAATPHAPHQTQPRRQRLPLPPTRHARNPRRTATRRLPGQPWPRRRRDAPAALKAGRGGTRTRCQSHAVGDRVNAAFLVLLLAVGAGLAI